MLDWSTLFDAQGQRFMHELMAAVRRVRSCAKNNALAERDQAEFASILLDAAEEAVDAMPNGQLRLLVGLLAIEAAGLPNNYQTNTEAHDGKKD